MPEKPKSWRRNISIMVVMLKKRIEYVLMNLYFVLTAYKVYTRCEAFEHITRVSKGVHGEPAPHGHNEKADDAERDHRSDVICKKTVDLSISINEIVT